MMNALIWPNVHQGKTQPSSPKQEFTSYSSWQGYYYHSSETDKKFTKNDEIEQFKFLMFASMH